MLVKQFIVRLIKPIIIISLLSVFVGCQSVAPIVAPKIGAIFSEPKLSINSVDITGIDFKGVKLLARVNVENPNSFSIPLPKIDWELSVNSSSFVNGSLENNDSIQSLGKAAIDIPLSLSYEGLYGSFSSLMETKEAAYDIALGLNFPIPLIEDKTYKLDFSGVLPMLQLPEISFLGITKKSLGTTMEFFFNWEVENKNNYAFDIGEFIYDFQVGSSSWAKGSLDNPPQLKANGKTNIPLAVSISSAPIVRELVTIINQGSQIAYTCTGNMSLISELTGNDKLEFPVNLNGNTRIR
jgi:LEA14-like dessication related protein